MFTLARTFRRTFVNGGQYGMGKLKVYRKTKSFVMYCSGHGSEHYDYYTMKNGKYKMVASKGRQSTAGGSMYTGPWGYSDGSFGEISESEHNSRVAKLRKGSSKTTKVSKWKTLSAY